MEQIINQIPDSMKGFCLAIALWLVSYLVKRKDKLEDDGKDALQKELSQTRVELSHLTIAITELNVTIKFLMQRTDKIPELEKDLNALGQKFRDLKN